MVGTHSRMSLMGGRLSRMSERGRVAIPNVREWLGDPAEYLKVVGSSPGCPGVLGRPAGCSGVVWKPSRMAGSGRDVLQNVREWLGGSLRYPGVVGRPFQMYGSGRDALPNVREWSGVS